MQILFGTLSSVDTFFAGRSPTQHLQSLPPQQADTSILIRHAMDWDIHSLWKVRQDVARTFGESIKLSGLTAWRLHVFAEWKDDLFSTVKISSFAEKSACLKYQLDAS